MNHDMIESEDWAAILFLILAHHITAYSSSFYCP
jgi:hypothetical protein